MITNNYTAPESTTKNRGGLRAYYMKHLVAAPLTLASAGALKVMKKTSNLKREDSITIKKAVSQALTETGLRKEGVKAYFVKPIKTKPITKYQDIITGFKKIMTNPSKADQKAMKAINTELIKTIEENKLLKKFKAPSAKMFEENPQLKDIIDKVSTIKIYGPVKKASNAFFLPKSKSILVPDGKLITSAFHEMGHALNQSTSKVGNLLQKYRPIATIAATAIALIGTFTKKKAEDETQNKGENKFTHFVKRNAGLLTLTAMAPVVVEEAMATIKGNKVASKLLDKKLLNKVKITNAFGLATYILGAIGMAVSTATAVRIKDNIQTNYEVKLAKKAAKKASKNKE